MGDEVAVPDPCKPDPEPSFGAAVDLGRDVPGPTRDRRLGARRRRHSVRSRTLFGAPGQAPVRNRTGRQGTVTPDREQAIVVLCGLTVAAIPEPSMQWRTTVEKFVDLSEFAVLARPCWRQAEVARCRELRAVDPPRTLNTDNSR